MENQQFVTRRKHLLGQLEAGSFAVFFAGEAPHKTTDQYYPFTVNKNFFYLTGLAPPTIRLIAGPNRPIAPSSICLSRKLRTMRQSGLENG
ncbi:MAG: aminopeptidase P N-terminal domain-containing protein [Bacillus subtilis]|nr:aminopeptidase P N-terminal domain-containing protein [Bacillus subtilis]